MTSATARPPRLIQRPADAAPRGEWKATLVLARREAVLLVRHPLHLAGLALACVPSLSLIPPHKNSAAAYFNFGEDVVMYYGILTYVAAYLCASRPTRSRARHWLDAAVTSSASRTAAMCLATLAPFAVACIAVAVEDPVIGAWSDRTVGPGAFRLLGSAVCILGAGLLGVAVSCWLRFVGAPLVVMVAVVAACVWADNHGHALMQPYVEWATSANASSYSMFMWVIPGSPGWHLLYLTGWTALAGCAALLAHRRWRYRVLAVAVAAGVLVVVAGAAQLP